MLSNILSSRLSPHTELFGIMNVDFNTVGQLLITFFMHSSAIGEKREYVTVCQIFIDFKEACD
jgi:hypothetical protein